jgi:hypothetical protein
MLRSTVSRIRLSVGALGCVILGASLFNWAQGLHAAAHQYDWVKINSADVPSAEPAEIWQVSASCVRPYFVGALLRSKARLKAYYDLAPAEVRARLDRPPDVAQSSQPTGWYRLVKSESDIPPPSKPNREYVAQLHVEYAEWYANVFKLETEESQWEQRLTDIADQRLIFSESARKSFGAYSGRDIKLASAGIGSFDDHVLGTLGLGGFPPDEEEALKSQCVNIKLITKVFKSPNYFFELWRWPVEQTAAFTIGLEFIFIGIFLVPITLWMGTGDPQLAAQHVRNQANRLAARLKNFDKNKFAASCLEGLRAIRARTRALLTTFGTRLGPIINRQVQVLARMAAIPNVALSSPVREQSNAGGKRGSTWPTGPFPRSRRRWRSRSAHIAAGRR